MSTAFTLPRALSHVARVKHMLRDALKNPGDVVEITESGYSAPVCEPQNPVAHGNICRTETYESGAIRSTNMNAGQYEVGPLRHPELEQRLQAARERVDHIDRVLKDNAILLRDAGFWRRMSPSSYTTQGHAAYVDLNRPRLCLDDREILTAALDLQVEEDDDHAD